MTSYWPSDINIKDFASPYEILQLAKEQWDEQSGGILTLVIQDTETSNGHRMLIVHAQHVPSNRTATLFSVIHRHDSPYPARIQPRENELPDFLKKSYYTSSLSSISAAIIGATALGSGPPKLVTNEWVCDTPTEFRNELRDVFNLGSVRSEVLSLVSDSSGSSEQSANRESAEQIAESKGDEDDTETQQED